MPISVTSSSTPVSQKGPSNISFGNVADLKAKQFEDSPCSSPGPTEHTTLKRRFHREPVRGPESALDSRFQTGITFSFAPSDSSNFLCIVNKQFESTLFFAPHVAPRSEIAQNIVTDVSAHESEQSESEYEVEDMSAELDDLYDERDEVKTPSKKTSAPSTPAVGVSRKTKQCACCGCTSTPLWRDMGKDMPLCNACGIRWKKYGVVCDACQYVPCKQERESKSCKRCSAPLAPANKRMRAASPQTVPKKF